MLSNTPSDYCAVIYPGGHGPMFDLAVDEEIAKITSDVFKNNGLVAACCHGPAGLFFNTVFFSSAVSMPQTNF